MLLARADALSVPKVHLNKQVLVKNKKEVKREVKRKKSTSQPTVRQLCEFFDQIAKRKITGEAIQELIERGPKIALSRLFKRIIQQARKVIAEISDLYLKAKTLTALASATQEAKDFEEARKVIAEISDLYLKAKALTALASALAEAYEKRYPPKESLRFPTGQASTSKQSEARYGVAPYKAPLLYRSKIL